MYYIDKVFKMTQICCRFTISPICFAHHEWGARGRVILTQLQLKHQNLIEVLQNQDVSVHVDA